MRHRFPAILLATVLFAVDISGSYSGTVSMQTPGGERRRPLSIVVKQARESLAVSVGPSLTEQHPASKAKLDGGKLTFEVVPPGAQDDSIRFELKVEADRLTGTQVITRGGESRTTQLDLRKQ